MRLWEIVNCAWENNTIYYVLWVRISCSDRIWLLNATINIYFVIWHLVESRYLLYQPRNSHVTRERVHICSVEYNRNQTCWILAHLRIGNVKLWVVSLHPVLWFSYFMPEIYCDIALHFRLLSTVNILRIKIVFSVKVLEKERESSPKMYTRFRKRKNLFEYSNTIHIYFIQIFFFPFLKYIYIWRRIVYYISQNSVDTESTALSDSQFLASVIIDTNPQWKIGSY